MKNGLCWVMGIARYTLQPRLSEFEDQLQKLEIRAINESNARPPYLVRTANIEALQLFYNCKA